MNLQQLRYISEVSRRGLNISAAAATLRTSQPGISKQIKLLEAELGVDIFRRSRNRLEAITPVGRRIVAIAQEVVAQLEQIQASATASGAESQTSLVVATSHTQARYVLPDIIGQFTASHQRVSLTLRHGDPAQIRAMLLAGEADLGVTTEAEDHSSSIMSLPCRRFERVLVVPVRHPLIRVQRMSLAAIAEYPLVAYEPAFTGRRLVIQAFERAGLDPKIVLSAIDADVIKACVERGLGVAVLSEVTYDRKRDNRLRALRLNHLFEPSITHIVFRRQRRLRAWEYDFIQLCASNWTRGRIDRALAQAI